MVWKLYRRQISARSVRRFLQNYPRKRSDIPGNDNGAGKITVFWQLLFVFIFICSAIPEGRKWWSVKECEDRQWVIWRNQGSGSRIGWMTPAKGVGRRDSSVSLFATSSSFFSVTEPEGGRRDSTVAFPDFLKRKTQSCFIRFPSSPPSHQQPALLVWGGKAVPEHRASPAPEIGLSTSSSATQSSKMPNLEEVRGCIETNNFILAPVNSGHDVDFLWQEYRSLLVAKNWFVYQCWWEWLGWLGVCGQSSSATSDNGIAT